MKVIKPVPWDDSMLIESNVPENDYPAWISESAYPVGARVIWGHQVYESAQGDNKGNRPPDTPLFWTLIGPTNRYRMFDEEVSTQTATVAGPLEVTVAPGLSNSIALLEVLAVDVRVVVRDGAQGPVLYERDLSLDKSLLTDWYEYFFEPFNRDTELVLTDLPPYRGMHVSVTVSAGPDGPTAVGALVFGSVYEIGRAERGATAGILDYSRKETSATGTTRFQKRRFSRRASLRAVVEHARLNRAYRLLSELRATPCVWIGTDAPGLEFFTIYGFYRDFSIDVAYATTSYCSLEIEGLV